MKKSITNRDQIAGLPALSIRQFFIEQDEPLTVVGLRSALDLNSTMAVHVMDRLVNEGYLKISKLKDGAPGLIKTSHALRLVGATTSPPLSREEGYNVVFKLLEAVSKINVSPETAHRIGAVKIIGKMLIEAFDEVPFVEAEILVEPFVASNPQIQQALEKLSAGFAAKQGQPVTFGQNRDNWSTNMIKDRLHSVHDLLCLRFISRPAPDL